MAYKVYYSMQYNYLLLLLIIIAYGHTTRLQISGRWLHIIVYIFRRKFSQILGEGLIIF